MRLTTIKLLARHYVRIQFEEGKPYRLCAEAVADFYLYPGKDLEESEWEEIQRKDRYYQVYRQALRFIGRRPYTFRELVSRLQQKKCDPEFIELVLAKLKKEGYISDNDTERDWVRYYASPGNRSIREIVNICYKRGISSETVYAYLSELGYNEAGACLKRFSKLKRRYASHPPEKRKNLLGAALFRMGFPYQLIRSVIMPGSG